MPNMLLAYDLSQSKEYFASAEAPAFEALKGLASALTGSSPCNCRAWMRLQGLHVFWRPWGLLMLQCSASYNLPWLTTGSCDIAVVGSTGCAVETRQPHLAKAVPALHPAQTSYWLCAARLRRPPSAQA